MLFGAVYCRIRKVSFMRLADTASMGLLITQIIGIWGNFFNRESFGEYTDTLFAMQIPAAAVDKSQITPLMQSHLAEAEGISYIQVHPLFLYESFWFLLLFVILLSLHLAEKNMQERFFSDIWQIFSRDCCDGMAQPGRIYDSEN